MVPPPAYELMTIGTGACNNHMFPSIVTKNFPQKIHSSQIPGTITGHFTGKNPETRCDSATHEDRTLYPGP